ncbi:MAG: tRNA 2-thiouridine(34) synthase MnmA [Deltaproteobacteria bacterium]|nr:MAG: tRNA 2-thiouridine(34) synthase MnmA [Deltaproteobacteria bacterium]
MKQLTAIALSGGIDSLVAAYLLKEQGHNIIGIHFITGYEAQPHDNDKNRVFSNTDSSISTTTKEDACHMVSRLADRLGIEVKPLDCRIDFKHKVVDYFTQTYQAGQTPNPCMICNSTIKFGTLLDFSHNLGASKIATGHYAGITRDHQERFHLIKGVDPKKEQSYFLALMSQKQLAHTLFPLERMTKSQVIKFAQKNGLEPVKKEESQDVCFIKNKNYGEFLALQEGFEPKPGRIVDINGNLLGHHRGLHLFTIGQRRGINCPSSEPYYVVSMDPGQNLLTVGFKKDLLSFECKINNINWINQKPNSPIKVHTRVRYRHKAAASKLFPVTGKTAMVRFEKPQSAITPGQCAVFYQNEEVLGGGWIVSD